MEAMTIRLVSVVEKERRARARLRAEAPGVGVRAWLEVQFEAGAGTDPADWMQDAYDRVLRVLDPA
jgi:hypothetical protein